MNISLIQSLKLAGTYWLCIVFDIWGWIFLVTGIFGLIEFWTGLRMAFLIWCIEMLIVLASVRYVRRNTENERTR